MTITISASGIALDGPLVAGEKVAVTVSGISLAAEDKPTLALLARFPDALLASVELAEDAQTPGTWTGELDTATKQTALFFATARADERRDAALELVAGRVSLARLTVPMENSALCPKPDGAPFASPVYVPVPGPPGTGVDPYDQPPEMDGEASPGTADEYARGDHRHPTDTTRQAVIADLAAIRSGAAAGATAVQPSALSAYRTAAAQDAIDGAQYEAIAAKYTKPASGIPASDLAPGVIPTVPVTSVNGETGDVVLSARDIGDGSGGTVLGGLQRLDSTKADSASIAPAFSASSTYAVGDYVTREGLLYKCTTAVSTAGAWNAANWTAVAVTGEMGGGGAPKNVWYGTASISGSTATVTTTSGDFSYADGNVIFVYFNAEMTGSATKTMVVDSVAGKTIQAMSSNGYHESSWRATSVVCFVCRDSKYQMVSPGKASTGTYGVTILSNATNTTNDNVAASQTAARNLQVGIDKETKRWTNNGVGPFSNTKQYYVGDLLWGEDYWGYPVLYRCTTDHKGNWNANHFEQATIPGLINERAPAVHTHSSIVSPDGDTTVSATNDGTATITAPAQTLNDLRIYLGLSESATLADVQTAMGLGDNATLEDALALVTGGVTKTAATVDQIPDVRGKMDTAQRNLLAYASTTTLAPETAVYRANLANDGTFPTITATAIPTAAAYFQFELELAVPSTVPSTITGPSGWTWIDGHGLPDPADLSGGETICISVRLDCTARTFLASVWRVA